jgi:hypothetical protein
MNPLPIFQTFLSVVKEIWERRHHEGSKVISYLDELQLSADQLVAVWQEAYIKLILAEEGKLPRHQLPEFVNPSFMTEIRARYESNTPALAGKVDDGFRQTLLRLLAQLQITRHLTDEQYQIARNGLTLAYFSVDQRPGLTNLKCLESAIKQMKEDAAALRVEISNYKLKL